MADLNYADVLAQLKRIESALDQLVNQKATKDWYTTAEVGEQLGKAEFTVREWRRLGRIRAGKRVCGRGNSQEWMINPWSVGVAQ